MLWCFPFVLVCSLYLGKEEDGENRDFVLCLMKYDLPWRTIKSLRQYNCVILFYTTDCLELGASQMKYDLPL